MYNLFKEIKEKAINMPIKPHLSLKGALLRTADMLDGNNIIYDWDQIESCNCGVVARCILGLSKNDLIKLMETRSGLDNEDTWKTMCNNYCSLSGIPNDQVFKALYDAGMRFEDFANLEFLTDQEVLAKAGLERPKQSTNTFYSNKQNLVKYLRAWVEVLDERENLLKETNYSNDKVTA